MTEIEVTSHYECNCSCNQRYQAENYLEFYIFNSQNSTVFFFKPEYRKLNVTVSKIRLKALIIPITVFKELCFNL